MKRMLVLLVLGIFVAIGFSTRPAAAQEKKETVKQAAHWSGAVDRIDKDNGTLTVRKKGGMVKDIHFEASTKWSTKSGGTADLAALKQGDRVVCNGIYEGNKFMASEVIVQAPQK